VIFQRFDSLAIDLRTDTSRRTVPPQRCRWRFTEGPAVLLSKSAKVGKTGPRGNIGDRTVIGTVEQFGPCSRQADLPPKPDWRKTQKVAEVFMQSSRRRSAMGDKVAQRNWPTRAFTNEIYRLLDIVGHWPAVWRFAVSKLV